jgi:hypothetical protein
MNLDELQREFYFGILVLEFLFLTKLFFESAPPFEAQYKDRDQDGCHPTQACDDKDF